MPLFDTILLLNASDGSRWEGRQREFRYVAAGNRVFAYASGLRLQSFFLPVRATGNGEVLGHRAFLDVDDFDFLAEPEAGQEPALPADGAEAAELDRRVRTLHALNYLLQPEQKTLFLQARPGAGAEGDPVFAFEDILRPCGLLPERVVLEFDRAGGGFPPLLDPALQRLPPTSYPCRC